MACSLNHLFAHIIIARALFFCVALFVAVKSDENEIHIFNFDIESNNNNNFYLQYAPNEGNQTKKASKSKRDVKSTILENAVTKSGPGKSSEGHEMPPFIPLVSIVYASCGKNYSCSSFPKDCQKNSNCFAHAAFNVLEGDDNSQFLHVVLTANTKGWVGVGFSKDDRMGDDAVVICRRSVFSYQVSIWLASNFHNESGRGTEIQKNDDDVTAVAGGFFNGIITCEFNLEMKFTTEKGIKIDFGKEKYFILLAVGPNQNFEEFNQLGKITRHSFSISSLNAELLGRGKKDHGIIPQMTHNLIIAHVILSILVYGFFMPSAILMSRFGQEAFGGKIFGDFQIWKLIHISFQVLSAFCNLINIILICVSRFGFGIGFNSSSSVYHAVFGLLSFFASFINFGVGISIHVIQTKKKPVSFVLKYFHWSIGHFTYFSGALELIRGAYLKKSWTCCSFSVSVGLTFLFYLGSNIFLMFNTDYLRRKQSIDNSTIRTFLGPAIQLKTETDQDYQVRLWTIIYTMIILFISSVLLLIELGLTDRTCDPTHSDYI